MRLYLLSSAFLFLILSLSISCQKEESEPSAIPTSANCDLQQHVGNWKFTLNGDLSTEFIGQIHKFNDSTLNITYQPSTAYHYFLQTEVDCKTGLIPFQNLPAGNHGSTTIEGGVTTTTFEYKRITRINYTGTEQVTTTHIVGVKQ